MAIEVLYSYRMGKSRDIFYLRGTSLAIIMQKWLRGGVGWLGLPRGRRPGKENKARVNENDCIDNNAST